MLVLIFMVNSLFCILLIRVLQKKNDGLTEGNIVKLYGEDYRHFLRGDKAFFVNKWKFKNVHKKSMDLLKQRLIQTIPVYKKYHNCKNCIQIINDGSEECFIDIPVNSCEEMLEIAKKSDIQILFAVNYEKKEFFISGNHGVIDGLSMARILIKLINKECQTYEMKNLDLTISNLLYSLTKIHIIKQCNPIITDLNKPKTIEFKLDANIIKNIMNKTNCAFSVAYAYYILKLINLDNVGVGTLTPGINKKSFNSYGIIPFVYHNKDTPSNINDKIINNSGYALLSNLFLSYSSNYLRKLYENKINILLSSIPFCKQKAFVGDMEIDFNSVYMPYHSCPIYVFSTKIENVMNINMSIKNIEIYENITKKIKDIEYSKMPDYFKCT